MIFKYIYIYLLMSCNIYIFNHIYIYVHYMHIQYHPTIYLISRSEIFFGYIPAIYIYNALLDIYIYCIYIYIDIQEIFIYTVNAFFLISLFFFGGRCIPQVCDVPTARPCEWPVNEPSRGSTPSRVTGSLDCLDSGPCRPWKRVW